MMSFFFPYHETGTEEAWAPSGGGENKMTRQLDDKQKTFLVEQNAKDLFATYAEYNKNLRAWFITFGIGGPGTILINDVLQKALVSSGAIGTIVYAFLAGCAIQIIIGFLNKYWTWYQYCDEISLIAPPRSWLRAVFEFCGRHVWTDIVADIVTAGCFGYAIVLMMRSLIK